MRILDEVAGAKTIGISGHIRPDGDCVGSCLGMKLFLEKAMPEAKVDCYLEKPADFFSCSSLKLSGNPRIHCHLLSHSKV